MNWHQVGEPGSRLKISEMELLCQFSITGSLATRVSLMPMDADDMYVFEHGGESWIKGLQRSPHGEAALPAHKSC